MKNFEEEAEQEYPMSNKTMFIKTLMMQKDLQNIKRAAYIQGRERSQQEAVEFLRWLLLEGYFDTAVHKEPGELFNLYKSQQ